MSEREQNVRERVEQRDITVMESYLEVDIATWLSYNKVPYAYQPFTIPGVHSVQKDEWDIVIDDVRNVGNGEDITIETPDGRSLQSDEVFNMWEDIYVKHRLGDKGVGVPVRDSLSEFDKRLVVPKFTVYTDLPIRRVERLQDDDRQFDWSSYSNIIEVGSPWGVGLPEEETEDNWWRWYRVSSVAMKEFLYKLFGLWDGVFWVIPDQPEIEGVSRGIPSEIRRDNHYIVVDISRSDIDMGRLGDVIGLTQRVMESGLSPPLEVIEYNRPPRGLPDDIFTTEYIWDGINLENVDKNNKTVIIDEEFVVYHGELGEVYISGDSVHVKESQWVVMNMILIREYVLDVLSELEDSGIIENLRSVDL